MTWRTLLRTLAKSLVEAKCRVCAAKGSTYDDGDALYLKKTERRTPDDVRHWSVDKVDYWRCGLSDEDRRVLANVKEELRAGQRKA